MRGLMVLVLIVGGLLGWQARRAAIQRRAIAAIQAAGGSVLYDYQAPAGKPFRNGASPPGPRWLREFLGDEYFREVAVVWLDNPRSGPPNVTPAALRAVEDCAQLQNLSLIYVPMDDEAILPFTRLKHLRTLFLLDVQGTEAALAAIRAMPSLRELTFRVKPADLPGKALQCLTGMAGLEKLELQGLGSIGRDDLEPLASLTGLNYLRLELSPAAGGWFDRLRGLTSLSVLDVRQTRASDADLQALAGLPNLHSLLIDGSDLTTAGMGHLGRMTALTGLCLASPEGTSRPTDAGLAELVPLTKLQMLWLDAGDLTASEMARLSHLPLRSVALRGLADRHRDLVAEVARRPLSWLELDGPGVAEDWIGLLNNQPSLVNLTLNRTEISDAALAILAPSLPALQYLALDETAITDAGLLGLAAAPTLNAISARGTKVTTAGVAALRAVRPGIEVDIGPAIPWPGHRPRPGRPVN